MKFSPLMYLHMWAWACTFTEKQFDGKWGKHSWKLCNWGWSKESVVQNVMTVIGWSDLFNFLCVFWEPGELQLDFHILWPGTWIHFSGTFPAFDMQNMSETDYLFDQISLCTCWPEPQHLSRSHCSFYSEVLHFSAGIWQPSSSQTAPFIPMRLHTKGLSCDHCETVLRVQKKKSHNL